MHPALPALAAVVSLQFGSALARTYFEEVGATGATTLRLLFGSLLLLAVFRPSVRGWNRTGWKRVVLLGFALAGMNSCIYLAIDRIPFGVAVTVEFLGPLTLALVQSRRLEHVAWALLALVGVVLLGSDVGGAASLVGLAFAAAAAAFWALYIVASSRLGRTDIGGVDGVVVALAIAAVFVLPLGAADSARAIADDATLLLVFLGVGLATSAVPYVLEFVALRRMTTRVFGVLSSVGPAVAAIAGLVVLDERLSGVQLAAIALVTVASVGVARVPSRRTPAPA
ncbi:MAG: transporter [Thermoleophilia bacterium]|nr:transporter [Thermoleophilia bacterium]